MSSSPKHYKAFISYSHRDAKWAKWLHRSLERYVVPIDAFPPEEQLEADGAKKSRRITPVFRDRDEVPASGSLAETIREALESSENLIVLCSPNSVGSEYVNAEIEMFRGLHPDNNKKIYALIIEGEPPECFPTALLDGDAEPIAADAREEGDGKGDSKLKLIAGMLGVGFDRLKRREAKRQRNRMMATVASVSAVAVITSVSTLWAMKAEREARKQKEIAEEQRELAVQRQTEAEQSARESKAVLRFYSSKMLMAAKPKSVGGGLGINVSVRKALDAAEPQVRDAFANQPLIEASIRYTFGEAYYSLGEYNNAVDQYEISFKQRKNLLGLEHSDTLHSMNNLANSYRVVGRLEEALILQEETLKLKKKQLGPEHPSTLISMHNLTNSYRHTGRIEEALKLGDETLKLRKKVLGPEHPDTLSTLDNLANSYRDVGRLEEALKLQGETLKLRKKVLGPEHPSTLQSMHNLAMSYDAAGRIKEALALKEKTLELRKKLLGPEHPNTLHSMNNLATSYRDAGRPKEALELGDETLKMRKKVLGPEHPDTLDSMNNLAVFYNDAGRSDEAETLKKEEMALRSKLKQKDPKK